MSTGLTLYHGSPHCFDRFSLAKIGTGEGKQVYGQGLYFAEEQKVAQAYCEELREWTVKLYDGKPFDAENPAHVAAKEFHKWRESFLAGRVSVECPVIEARATALYSLRSEHQARRKELTEAQRTINLRAADVLEARGEAKVRTRRVQAKPGNVYTVRIAAEPDEFLQWNLPTREQSPRVIERLHRAAQNEDVKMARALPGVFSRMQYDHETGSELYYALAGRGTHRSLLDDCRQASAFLDAAGIRGVRYLDQQSRSLGFGTYNYVLFSDAIIEVTHRNGVSLAKPAREAAMEEIRQDERVFKEAEKTDATLVSDYLPTSEEKQVDEPARLLL